MQKSKIKKTLIFMLPSTVISALAPLASASCGTGKYSYLNDIEFKLINSSITTNQEIVEEFKKDPQSIKNYIEIINPNKYDLEIKDVEPVGNSSIKILIKASKLGKDEYNGWTKQINGCKDLSKDWNLEELKKLSKILLEKIKNNPRDLIDLENTNIRSNFPSDINSTMIKLKSYDFITKKSPDIKLIAEIDSNLADDANGILPVYFSLINKKVPDKIKHKFTDKNLIFDTSDGLLSLNNLIKELKVDDLVLPNNISQLLPSKYNENFDLKDNFKREYPNVELVKTSTSNRENDNSNGIKNLSFKLKYKNTQSTETTNIKIKNKFYSTNMFQELVDNITANDLNIQVEPFLLPSKYETNNIKLKNTSDLLDKNPNLKIEKSVVVVDDVNGDLTVDLLIQDTVNELSATKTFRYTGFYNIDKYNKLVNSMTISDLDIQVVPFLLPTNFNPSNIKLKNDSQLLTQNPNLKIANIEKLTADDNNGSMNINITLIDEINNLSHEKTIELTDFYNINKFKKLAESLSIDDLNVKISQSVLPSNYDVSNINFKSDSQLLAKNPNLEIKSINKSLVEDEIGNLTINVTIVDKKNNSLNYSKNIKISGFAKSKWTVSQLDEFVDKIVSTPIEEGKYFEIIGHVRYKQVPILLSKKMVNIWFHRISFNENNPNIPQLAPSIVSDREPSDSRIYSHKVNVRWNIEGQMRTTYAQKVSVKLKYDNGNGNIVFSSKTITLYFIAAPKLCDVDFRAEEV
ncbi:lipoprotein 17-related variable surface protein [Mycoplasmopsis primatum]|uniref:lipoprotein 17-related variable surface protein n=1 Tax=Mycoplasmopsis primatum TaxID=55604 RepID=UPI000495C2A7|nr:lipoprotein 17-related variable surface protein [Mycoplasmopsis primatum]